MRLIILIFTTAVLSSNISAQRVGIFEDQTDVSKVLHKGSSNYNSKNFTYQLSGSGSNIWMNHDEFHYLYKKIKGDFILQARGSFIGKGTDPHRKFGWMIRNDLDTNSVMASVQIHGDGLAALQYRKTAGGNVEEKRSAVKAPDVIQIEKKGNKYIMSVANFGEPYVTEEVEDLKMNDEVYVGLFICAHNKDVIEKTSFDNVRIIKPAKENFAAYREYIGSNIEVLDVANGNREILYYSPESLQAPNWTKDGKALIYNGKGLIYHFDLKKKTPELINTDYVKGNNNDHVISFNGKMLGLSSSGSDAQLGSQIYTVPINGGKPILITPAGPSYLHGWSPDGKYLTFTGQRNNEFDIYTIPSNGGNEIRLTTTPGLDDGSEYSPDGKYIYFNSVRSGMMQLWRMKPDGSGQEQLTNDEYNNWFPHISPDGKTIVFLSFMKDVPPSDHPFYKRVYLRMMPVSGGTPKVICYFYGGQGSINTPSWSPDSKKVAFISNSDFNSLTK
jgi:Periplasmic component of the Tol biopolymer transport system